MRGRLRNTIDSLFRRGKTPDRNNEITSAMLASRQSTVMRAPSHESDFVSGQHPHLVLIQADLILSRDGEYLERCPISSQWLERNVLSDRLCRTSFKFRSWRGGGESTSASSLPTLKALALAQSTNSNQNEQRNSEGPPPPPQPPPPPGQGQGQGYILPSSPCFDVTQMELSACSPHGLETERGPLLIQDPILADSPPLDLSWHRQLSCRDRA
jgi:hypothetical protein